MPLTIAGVPFDPEPQTGPGYPNLGSSPYASEESRREVYRWDCRKQEGKWQIKLDSNDQFAVPNIVDFFVEDAAPLTFKKDKIATLKMKIKVLEKLKFKSTDDLVTVSHRVFGKHKVKIDLSGFDWLKPLASFSVWMDIQYQYFAFSNYTEGLHFYIGLPHKAEIRVDISGFCKPAELERLIENGKSTDKISLGLTRGGTKNSRDIRRRYLMILISRLRYRTLEMDSSEWLKLQLEELIEEWKTLE